MYATLNKVILIGSNYEVFWVSTISVLLRMFSKTSLGQSEGGRCLTTVVIQSKTLSFS